MPLYGNELGPDVTPFEAGLGRVVKFDKPGDFVGREALAARAASGPRQHLVGLTISPAGSPGTATPSSPMAGPAATVTSGAPSPTLGRRSPWPTWSQLRVTARPVKYLLSASGAKRSRPS